MFYGTYHHAIDAKGRTSLPAKFREALVQAGENRVFLIQAPGMKALRALPQSLWKRLEAWAMAQSPFDLKAQRLILRFVSSAQEIDLDEHGRVLVPAALRSYAGLAKDVVWTGMGQDLCLWDRETYEKSIAEDLPGDDLLDVLKGVGAVSG